MLRLSQTLRLSCSACLQLLGPSSAVGCASAPGAVKCSVCPTHAVQSPAAPSLSACISGGSRRECCERRLKRSHALYGSGPVKLNCFLPSLSLPTRTASSLVPATGALSTSLCRCRCCCLQLSRRRPRQVLCNPDRHQRRPKVALHLDTPQSARSPTSGILHCTCTAPAPPLL